MTKNRFTSTPGLILLGLAAMLLAWRIVVTNMAELFVQDDGEDAAALALNWNKNNAQALFSEGLRIARANPASATAYLSSQSATIRPMARPTPPLPGSRKKAAISPKPNRPCRLPRKWRRAASTSNWKPHVSGSAAEI